MEENRINRVQEFIQKSADIETDVLSILNTCVLGIKKAASAVNANEVSFLRSFSFKDECNCLSIRHGTNPYLLQVVGND